MRLQEEWGVPVVEVELASGGILERDMDKSSANTIEEEAATQSSPSTKIEEPA